MFESIFAKGKGNSFVQIWDDSIDGTPVLQVYDDQSQVEAHHGRIELPRHEMIDFLRRALTELEKQ